MIARKVLFFAPLALAAAGLTACVSLFGGESVKVRPVNTVSSLTAVQFNPLYESAVTAINARDYARALDYLQEEKARDPRNVKVLNALGVVYDKLGRFDLSARYYAQANAVDPGSRIVAANVEYSKVLQDLHGVNQHTEVAALETPGEKSSPAEGPAAIPSSPVAVTAQAAPAEKQATIAAFPTPSVISAPVVRPVASPVVVASISPDVVAPSVLGVEKKPMVLPASSASSVEKKAAILPASSASDAPIVRVAEKQATALIIPTGAKSETKGAVVTAPNSSANLVRVLPVTEKSAVVPPVHTASVPPVTRPAEKQTAALIAPAGAKLETKAEVVAAANPPANFVRVAPVTEKPAVAVPVAAKLPAVLPIHAVLVAPPVARPAEIQPVGLLKPSPTTPEMKGAVVAAPKLRAAVVQNGLVAKKLAEVPPRRFASVAPPAPLEKKQSIALPVPSVAKPAKPGEGRIAIPAAFRTSVAPALPVKVVFSSLGNGKILTLGRPVMILNASGRHGGVGPVSHRLTMLGWTIRQSDSRMQPTTTLYYPAKNIVAARAMLRTLPFPARFTPDNNSDPSAMRLMIGRDYLSWKPRNSRLAALWQKSPVVALLQKQLLRGVR